jgi:hypothetical protein
MFGQHLGEYSITFGYLNSWREQNMTEEQRRFEDLAIDEQIEAQKELGRPFDKRALARALAPLLEAIADAPNEVVGGRERQALLLALDDQIARDAEGGGPKV